MSFVPGRSMLTVRLHVSWRWVRRMLLPSSLARSGRLIMKMEEDFGDFSFGWCYLSSLFSFMSVVG